MYFCEPTTYSMDWGFHLLFARDHLGFHQLQPLPVIAPWLISVSQCSIWFRIGQQLWGFWGQFFCLPQRVKSRALHMLGKCSTTKLHPHALHLRQGLTKSPRLGSILRSSCLSLPVTQITGVHQRAQPFCLDQLEWVATAFAHYFLTCSLASLFVSAWILGIYCVWFIM